MPNTTHFDAVSINNAGIQFKESGGTYAPGTPFGCVGSIEGEPEIRTRELKCGAKVLKTLTKTDYFTFTVQVANAPLSVVRSVFGLNTEGLKAGVWSYGERSKSKDFIFTADIIDEFEDVTKMIAFPNATNISGFRIQTIDNGADEVANLEFEFRAMADENGQFYYEAIVDDVTDEEVKEQWHTAFTTELVEAVPSP